MTLELSNGWFRLEAERQAAYVRDGRQRLDELNAALARPDISGLARDAISRTTGADRALFRRAIEGEDLDPRERRRVEYLALKLTARKPGTP
jgi:hypothetical protein